MDLADFPEDEPISLNAVIAPNVALKPVRYTRSSRDAYNEALKQHNDKILTNNKKYALNNPTDETSFEDAVKKNRKEFERFAMDPNGNGDPDKHTTSTMTPPELGGTGWVDVLRPNNPVDSIKVDNPINSWLQNMAKDVGNAFDYYITRSLIGAPSEEQQNLYDPDPVWNAYHEAGLKQERNRRRGVSPSIVNPLKTGNYFDSPEYFDRIQAVADRIYGYKAFDRSTPKLSPFDIISLQFGKDKTKERNEFLEKQKQYLIRTGSDQSSESDQAKLARAYADLRDPSYDEKVLYEPIYISNFNRNTPIYKNNFNNGKEIDWAGQTSPDNTDMYLKTLLDISNKQNKKQKETGITPSPSSVQRDIQKAIDDEMRINPSAFKSQIDLNKSKIKDWEEFISVLGHEAQHVLGRPELIKSKLENLTNHLNSQEIQYKAPATIRYGLEPSIGGMSLGSGYEELEKRKLADSFKGYSKDQMKYGLEKDDIPGPGITPEIPSSYYWSRPEMPAFMTQLKLNLLNKTGKYPTSNETDEEIEQDRDKLYDMSPRDMEDSLSYLKALEFMKTPEGKAIWRGVQKTSPKKNNRYA